MFTPEEAVRAIRASLIGEQDAISQYDAQAEMTDNPVVRKTLEDISREEKVHQGQLIELLSVLGDDMFIKDGQTEVKKLMEELDACADAGCTRLKLADPHEDHPHRARDGVHAEQGAIEEMGKVIEKTPETDNKIGLNQMCQTQEIHCGACVPPDTLITADIPVSIKELSEGDKIADTRLGKMQIANRISKVYTHQYDGDLIIVKPQGCLPLELTPDHEVLILPAEKMNYGKHRVKLGQPVWIKAGELTRRPDPYKPYASGHYLVMPVRKGSYGNHHVSMAKFTTPHGQEMLKRRNLSHLFPLNESTAWFIGLYIADGSASVNNGRIQISLHSDEIDIANKVLAVCSIIGLLARIRPIKNEKAIEVHISSRVLSRALKGWCGVNA